MKYSRIAIYELKGGTANQAVRPSNNPLWPATPPTVRRTAAGSTVGGRRTWTVASQMGSSGSGGTTRHTSARRASGVV